MLQGIHCDELRKEPGAPGGATKIDLDEVLRERKERHLLCVACRTAIARLGDRIEVEGDHQHTAVNPHGYIYTIGCFRRADGCAVHGSPTEFWSWFSGYLWQTASCGGCGAHLGWAFTSASDAFFGLILERLVEDEDEGDGQGDDAQ